MDSALENFTSHLDDDIPFSPNQHVNEIWADLEKYFEKSVFDIDNFLDELFPVAQPMPMAPMENDFALTEVPAPQTTAEMIKSLALSETFFNDLIVNPVLDFKGKNFVPIDILLNSIRSNEFTFTGRRYDYPFETAALCRVRPLRKDFVAPIDTNLNPSLSLNIDWKAILESQQPLSGMTVDVMVENILRSCSKTQLLPSQEEISTVIGLLFKDLNVYIDGLSVEFGDRKFFDASQFDDISRKLQAKISSHFNAEPASLRDILQKWMVVVTEKFVCINDQRRQVEEKVSGKIIDRAVEVYSNRLMSTKGEENIFVAQKKQSDIICQAIRRMYSNCGVSFIGNVLAEFEERLKNVHSTSEKSSICRRNPTAPNSDVLIELLVSEYVSNINQKGLQCAGISTIQQFDDVNATCLRDTVHIFERKMNGISFDERNDLKDQLQSKLTAESNEKRFEFQRRSPTVAAAPSSISSACPYSVGIHFGFENLSVSCCNHANNSLRTICGPVVNVVSFADQGVSIGEIPADGCSLNMETMLTTLNVDQLYDTKYYGKLKLEAIIAVVLMHIDEMVKQNLHTITRIKYAIAIPSCLGETMQHTFKTAINIADINCNLVREQCALTTIFIRETHQAITKNKDELLITMIERSNKACDSVVYAITGTERKVIQVLRSRGSEAKSLLFGYVQCTGLKSELVKMKSEWNKRIRFIICCPDQESCNKEVKNQFNFSKLNRLNFDSSKIGHGAALLSSATIDGKSNLPFDLRQLTSIKRITGDVEYRFKHFSSSSEPLNLAEIRAQLRSLIDNQLEELSKSKSATKQLIIGKMKDLEESNLTEDKKIEYRQNLEKSLQGVCEEKTKKVVEEIAHHWKKCEFSD